MCLATPAALVAQSLSELDEYGLTLTLLHQNRSSLGIRCLALQRCFHKVRLFGVQPATRVFKPVWIDENELISRGRNLRYELGRIARRDDRAVALTHGESTRLGVFTSLVETHHGLSKLRGTST